MERSLHQKRVSTVIIVTIGLLFLISGCGNNAQNSPAAQTSTTDQIVVIQTTPSSVGGGGAPVSAESVSPVSLPQPLFQSTAVTFTDLASGQSFVYVIGGAYYDLTLSPDPINVNTVYRSLVQGGALSPWVVENSSLPANLRGHSTVIYNNEIFVIGGIGIGFQKAIYQATIKMDTSNPPLPVLGQWRWVGDLPVEETGQASVVSGGMLYVVGGVESGLPDFATCSPNCVGSQTTVFSDKIYGYNLASFSASSGSTLTTAVPTFTMPKKLYTPAAIGLPNQIWVLGGWDGVTNSNSDTAYSFNVTNGFLSNGPSCSTSPCLPYGGVSKAIGLFLADAPLQEMVLIGGVSGDLNTPELVRKEVYASPLPSGGIPSWSPAPSLPKPVSYFSATSVGSVIFVFGGISQ
jgi:hypothetical protein